MFRFSGYEGLGFTRVFRGNRMAAQAQGWAEGVCRYWLLHRLCIGAKSFFSTWVGLRDIWIFSLVGFIGPLYTNMFQRVNQATLQMQEHKSVLIYIRETALRPCIFPDACHLKCALFPSRGTETISVEAFRRIASLREAGDIASCPDVTKSGSLI